MDHNKLGINEYIINQINELGIDLNSIARVIKEHKERYIISTSTNELEAEITGNLRFSAISRADFPAVGDWVEFISYDSMAIINKIIPRYTLLERKAVSSSSERQIIAANIDSAFIIQAVDRDYNINRLERYISLIYSCKIEPLVVLNKSDLITETELNKKIDQVRARFKDIKVITTNSIQKNGIDNLKNILVPNKTYCLVGSSGVGKSSLINALSESNYIKTNTISDSTNKGKHTTTHRELILLENGSILIDTPGMREIGLTDMDEGIHFTFNDIEKLANECRFKNCTHTDEPGCAVLEAIKNGTIDQKLLENHKKLLRETEHFQRNVADKRKKDKEFGKMVKQILKEKKKNKY